MRISKVLMPLAFLCGLAACEMQDTPSSDKNLPQVPGNNAGTVSACTDGSGSLVVPNVLGLTARQAQATLARCDLELVLQPNVGTQSYQAIGTIGSQSPFGGEAATEDGRVTVFLSRGFYLPNLVGWQADTAENWLRDLRLNVRRESRRDSAPVGTVISHSPANAELFNAGTQISLLISEGLWLDLPNFEGARYSDAKRELEALNLRVVHVGGSLDTGSRQINVCEREIWYPVVSVQAPGSGRVFEGSQVRINTKRKSEFIFYKPPGSICP